MKIIKSDDEYRKALSDLENLMDQDPPFGSEESNEMELLALIIEHYESNKYVISLPSPVEAIKFRMEQQGLKQKDLVPYIGSQSKVSEILSGKRTLSLNMIKKLHAGLGISAEILVQ